jgi:hypothetical protein
MRRAVVAALVMVASLFVVTPVANASATETCDLRVARAVGYSALNLYVGVGLEGCSTSVMEVYVELKLAPDASGPYTTVADNFAYSGGAAWFDGSYGCGYYIGVAHWQDQTETTPTPWHYCT